jgi:hypothetical protein
MGASALVTIEVNCEGVRFAILFCCVVSRFCSFWLEIPEIKFPSKPRPDEAPEITGAAAELPKKLPSELKSWDMSPHDKYP